MAVYRNDENKTWYTTFCDHNAEGQRKHKTKRSFKTQAETAVRERDFLEYYSETMEMAFEDFAELYFSDVEPRIRMNTMLTKKSIVSKYITPAFKGKRMSEITGKDILRWQNNLMDGGADAKGLSSTYLRTINSQVSVIFNHAVRYYDLRLNPMRSVAPIGEKSPTEMLFWTKDDDRIFQTSKSFLHYEMRRCSNAAGVKGIRVHDLRHSHVSLLINMEYSALSIADRIGHESVDITYRYAHLLLSVQTDMTDSLNEARGGF